MKIPAISGLPVSVALYTETGLQDPQKASPKQGISCCIADTNANLYRYATQKIHDFHGHSMQPAGFGLSRYAMHSTLDIVHAVERQPPTGRTSQARPALYPV